MARVLAELGLAELVTSIRGVSVVGAAAILAETGDPARFDPVRRRQSGGQARRAVPGCAPATTPRAPLRARPPSPVELRSRPAAAAAGRLAGRLGCVAAQPGVRRPLRPPDQPPDQSAQRHPGPHRGRRCPAAPAVGGVRQPGPLGAGGCRRRRPQGGDRPSCLTRGEPARSDAAERARPGLGNNPLISLGSPAHLLQARMRAVGTNPVDARWSQEVNGGTPASAARHTCPFTSASPATSPASPGRTRTPGNRSAWS
jgi:hypothetical protein